jgi:hypothetical protein
VAGFVSNRERKLNLEMCAFIGRFIGLAISIGERIPLTLCPHVARFLMGQPPMLADLAAVDGELFSQLQNLLEKKKSEPSSIAAMQLTFTVGCPPGFGPETMNLKELPQRTGEHPLDYQRTLQSLSRMSSSTRHGSGGDVLMARVLHPPKVDADMDKDESNEDEDEEFVNADNVEEFVELYSAAILRWNVIDQLRAMRDGLMEFIPPSAWRGGSPADFNHLLGGAPTVSMDEIRKRTHISGGGGGASTQIISTWFWSVVESMTQRQRSKLLYFSTGSTRLPAGTSHALNIEIVGSLSAASLPSATTCSKKLQLPAYNSLEQLQQKLLLAIEDCTTYELQ